MLKAPPVVDFAVFVIGLGVMFGASEIRSVDRITGALFPEVGGGGGMKAFGALTAAAADVAGDNTGEDGVDVGVGGIGREGALLVGEAGGAGESPCPLARFGGSCGGTTPADDLFGGNSPGDGGKEARLGGAPPGGGGFGLFGGRPAGGGGFGLFGGGPPGGGGLGFISGKDAPSVLGALSCGVPGGGGGLLDGRGGCFNVNSSSASSAISSI